jgi:hypothetical protein
VPECVGAYAVAGGAGRRVGGADPVGVNKEEIRNRVRLALAEALLPRDLPRLVRSPPLGQPREKFMETGRGARPFQMRSVIGDLRLVRGNLQTSGAATTLHLALDAATSLAGALAAPPFAEAQQGAALRRCAFHLLVRSAHAACRRYS